MSLVVVIDMTKWVKDMATPSKNGTSRELQGIICLKIGDGKLRALVALALALTPFPGNDCHHAISQGVDFHYCIAFLQRKFCAYRLTRVG